MPLYKHGGYSTESGTGTLVVNETAANITFVVGTAPINLVDETNVNKLQRIQNLEEASALFGFIPDYTKYSLCEAMDVFFKLYQTGPLYLVNVLDPAIHFKISAETNILINRQLILAEVGIIKSTVQVMVVDQEMVLDTDYQLFFNDKGQLVIMTLESGSIKPDDTLTVNYNVLDPSMITADDIIGGISDTGDYSGIQLAQKAYPQFNEVLGSLIAPSWSQDIKVSVALLSIAKKLNSVFIANAIVDLDTSSCKKYQDAIDVKQKSSLIDAHYNLCFGDAYLADTKYNLSTLVAAVKQYITQQNDNFPNQNPSNKLLYINNFKLNGKELYLDREQANYLNANGIITARNGTSGWRVWGNRTACFPSDTDIKNFDIAVRDCFNFVRNTCVVSVDQMVDSQIDRALILRIESTLQGWVDGLVGSGKLISGKINFLKDRNPLSELLAGNIYFNLQITSGPTASSISIDVAFNVNDLNRIFEG